MAIHIHTHHHYPEGGGSRAVLEAIEQLGAKMTDALQGLSDEVTQAVAEEGAAITLIQAFQAELNAAGTDPAKLAALKTALANSDQALEAAIAAAQPPQTGAPDPASTGIQQTST